MPGMEAARHRANGERIPRHINRADRRANHCKVQIRYAGDDENVSVVAFDVVIRVGSVETTGYSPGAVRKNGNAGRNGPLVIL